MLNNICKVSYLNYRLSNRISKWYLDMTVIITGWKIVNIHIPGFSAFDNYDY